VFRAGGNKDNVGVYLLDYLRRCFRSQFSRYAEFPNPGSEVIEKELGIKAGETSSDYKFTFEVVYCLGSCGLSPVATINERVVGRLVPEKMVQILREAK